MLMIATHEALRCHNRRGHEKVCRLHLPMLQAVNRFHAGNVYDSFPNRSHCLPTQRPHTHTVHVAFEINVANSESSAESFSITSYYCLFHRQGSCGSREICACCDPPYRSPKSMDGTVHFNNGKFDFVRQRQSSLKISASLFFFSSDFFFSFVASAKTAHDTLP